MNTPSLPTCPACKQTDQIQKVTSAYGLNTKEWYETHTHTDADGNMRSHREKHEAHTKLGLRLKPPQKPTGPFHPGLWYGIGVFVFLFICSMLFPLLLIPLSLIAPMLGLTTFLPEVSGVPTWVIPVVLFGGGTLCIVILVIALLFWAGIKVKQRFDRDLANYQAKKVAYERDELPRWQRANARWEQLYYCMRDETVFIPAENRAVRVDDMEKYLYNPLFRN
ncbi:MAG: hypothetical protein ACOY0R_21585 [Chloroflexota bacterium]|jgi:nitrogen fixation-related uncharacterized protein